MAEPVFSPELKRNNKFYCLVCTKEIEKRVNKVQLGTKGWKRIKEDAEQWSKINIPSDNKYYIYTRVHERVCEFPEPFGVVHGSCRSYFGTKTSVMQEQFGVVSSNGSINSADENPLTTGAEENPSSVKNRLRSSQTFNKNKCFICFEETDKDLLSYNSGGLAR